MGCTYVKEFSFGGKVTPAAAVHKHEKALHQRRQGDGEGYRGNLPKPQGHDEA